MAHLDPYSGVRQRGVDIVAGGEGHPGQESAGTDCRAGVGKLTQVTIVAGEEGDTDVIV